MKPRIFAIIACLIAAGFSMGASAAWPERPIRILVPYPPGGTSDSTARVAAEWIERSLKQSVVVENRPGAGGAIAAEYLSRAPADGYTLILASSGVMNILPRMQKVGFDTLKSFAPVYIMGIQRMALAVNSTIPVSTLAELVAYAKERPGRVSFASPGNGSTGHLTMALLLKRAGVTMTHVPYKGNVPALNDLLGGHIPMYAGSVFELVPHYRSGRIKILAISSDKRMAQVPNVPTVAEQGYPGFLAWSWNALLAPAGTPTEVISTLADAFKPACHDREFEAKLAALGTDALCNTPEQFAERLRTDWNFWGEAVEISGAAKQ